MNEIRCKLNGGSVMFCIPSKVWLNRMYVFKRTNRLLFFLQQFIFLFLFCCFFGGYANHAEAEDQSIPFGPPSGIFFPTDSQSVGVPVNENAINRTIPYTESTPLLYTKMGHLTKIFLPSPPMDIACSRQSDFTFIVQAHLNLIIIKPRRHYATADLTIFTEQATYDFSLHETPGEPWDSRIYVQDPYKNNNAPINGNEELAVEDLVRMVYSGYRNPKYQYVPLDFREPNTEYPFSDPLTKRNCNIKLKRVLSVMKTGVSVYWFEIKNLGIPKNVLKRQRITGDFAIADNSFFMKNLISVVFPGFAKDSISTLEEGNVLYIFAIVKEKAIPKTVTLKFSLIGETNVPLIANLATGDGNVIAPKQTDTEKARKKYEQAVKDGKLPPNMTPDEAQEFINTENNIQQPDNNIPQPQFEKVDEVNIVFPE